ncbi:hypothetical protein DIPPA_12832 [Diplonema papillatum]|nr:hypothetical protein DIPPA_12832 [Diplonema papillatum]
MVQALKRSWDESSFPPQKMRRFGSSDADADMCGGMPAWNAYGAPQMPAMAQFQPQPQQHPMPAEVPRASVCRFYVMDANEAHPYRL